MRFTEISNPKIVILPEKRILMIVLYSLIDQRWKIGDFGYTSEGTSKELRPSDNRRGTTFHRSPELLAGEYNNKTDIWAIGTIVYEFCTQKKAFQHDYQTMDYKYSGGKPRKTVFEDSYVWPADFEAGKARELLRTFVDRTLQLCWEDRPSCSDLLLFLRDYEMTR